MSVDGERLQAKFASGALYPPQPPQPGAPSLVDLARALWSLADATGPPPHGSAAAALAARIGPAEHLVFVLVDGLGLELLEAMPAASFLWQHRAGELRSVFPSTTAVALTSLFTAAWPAQHGVLGHWLVLPDRQLPITVLPFAARGDGRPLSERGIDPAEVFALPSLLARVPRGVHCIVPAAIATSGYSAYSLGERARHGYRSLSEAMDAAIDLVRAATAPTFTWLYIARIDDLAHEHGAARLEVSGAVRELDAHIARLATALRGRARIVLSADHGHLAVPADGRAVLRLADVAGQLEAAPRALTGGDARVVTFHVGADSAQAFAAAVRERLGERFAVLPADELAALGLLGPEPPTPAARARLGDVVAISLGADVLDVRASGGRGDPRLALASQHSGLSAAEMRVPLIIV
jgi:hypothetical protein